MTRLIATASMALKPFWQLFHVTCACFSFLAHYVQLRLIKRSIRRKDPGRQFIIVDLIEHMGDIVACEPVARHVKERYPDSYLVWAVRKPYRELIDTNPHVDRTLVVFCLTEWILLSKTSLFDEMIDLHINGRVCARCNIPLRKHKGDPAVTLENYYDFGGALASFSKSAGIVVADTGPCVYIPRKVQESVDQLGLPARFISVHCTSNEVSRDWTREKWRTLLDRIFAETGLSIVEVGSRPALGGYRHPRWVPVRGRTSPLQTAEVIRRSVLFIGVDSGPAHLANAVGTFGILLFGHYRKFTSHLPYSGAYRTGENAVILRQDGPLSDMDVDTVLQSVRKALNRSDTGRKG